MVRLKVLSGKMAGVEKTARHFPFYIGRANADDLQLEADGVWDQHLKLTFHPQSGFVLRTQSNAIAAINGELFKEAVLRNGDGIEVGGVKLRFWLGDTRQSSLALRETLTWIAFVLVTAGQVALIYQLMR